MRTTRYFDLRMGHISRADVTAEMIARVVAAPVATAQQEDGQWQLWGLIEETGRYLRVVTLEDRETINNAFWDRTFTRRKP
ncbi:MAG: hypothetical protein ABIO78_09750 [Thermoanaerobaculia bacterium]